MVEGIFDIFQPSKSIISIRRSLQKFLSSDLRFQVFIVKINVWSPGHSLLKSSYEPDGRLDSWFPVSSFELLYFENRVKIRFSWFEMGEGAGPVSRSKTIWLGVVRDPHDVFGLSGSDKFVGFALYPQVEEFLMKAECGVLNKFLIKARIFQFFKGVL